MKKKFNVGDKVYTTTDGVYQDTQESLNDLRGVVVNTDDYPYNIHVKIDDLKGNPIVGFSEFELTKLNTTPGKFDPEGDLMLQLADLTTEALAKKWYKQYLKYHRGVDQGVQYMIGYFSDKQHRDNLYNWLK